MGDDMSDEDFCPPYKRSVSIHGFAIAGDGTLPTFYALHQNHPNPFNPATKICFSLPQASRVKLQVYNIMGQVVTILVDEQLEAGEHEVVWNGKDVNGHAAASGVYFYRIMADDFMATRKMVLLK
jgi:hypothetical protein